MKRSVPGFGLLALAAGMFLTGAALACEGCPEHAKAAAAQAAPECPHAKAAAEKAAAECPHHAAAAAAGHTGLMSATMKSCFGPLPSVPGATMKAYRISNGMVVVYHAMDEAGIAAVQKAARQRAETLAATCAKKDDEAGEMCAGCKQKMDFLRQAKVDVVDTEDGAITVMTAASPEAVAFLQGISDKINQPAEPLKQASI
jgi:hypothetical protein